MVPVQRILEVVRDVLVEFAILVFGDFVARPDPQGRGLVDGFFLDRGLAALFPGLDLAVHDHRKIDMIRIRSDNRAQLPVVQKLVFRFAQPESHLGAAVGLFYRRDTVFAFTLGDPFDALVGAGSSLAGAHPDFIGDDEGGIKADAELADQARIVFLVAGHRIEESTRARLGDGADIFDHFIARHADAVVADGKGARFLVVADLYFQLDVVFVKIRVGNGAEPEAVAGVRGVGNQFAKKNILVRVQRMDHQIQQLVDLGLESPGFAIGGGRHISLSPAI